MHMSWVVLVFKQPPPPQKKKKEKTGEKNVGNNA